MADEDCSMAVDSDELIKLELSSRDNVFRVDKEGLTISQKQVKKLSNAFASGHINILLGSGFSTPKIPPLSNREEWFTKALNEKGEGSSEMMLLQAEYGVNILNKAVRAVPSEDQISFIAALRDVLRERGNTSLPRRANIFTTNYDFMIERSCEEIGLPYNDGFDGRFNPVFRTESFSRVLCKQSFAHEYLTQIPTVSVMKVHGSLNWKRDNQHIYYKAPTSLEKEPFNLLLDDEELISFLSTISELVKKEASDANFQELTNIASQLSDETKDRLQKYAASSKSLCIVNPTKHKFEETILELGYYELLRLFSNELDRNNALLIAFGFSFKDEHILQITKRALGNPKLLLMVFCYECSTFNEMKQMFNGFNNVWFVVGEGNLRIDSSVAANIIRGVTNNG